MKPIYLDNGVMKTGPAIGQFVTDTFVAVTDYDPGVTTQLTLSLTPVSADTLTVTFDGLVQHDGTYSLAGAVLTFVDPIPASTLEVQVRFASDGGSGGGGSFNIADLPVSPTVGPTDELAVNIGGTMYRIAVATLLTLVSVGIPAFSTGLTAAIGTSLLPVTAFDIEA